MLKEIVEWGIGCLTEKYQIYPMPCSYVIVTPDGGIWKDGSQLTCVTGGNSTCNLAPEQPCL